MPVSEIYYRGSMWLNQLIKIFFIKRPDNIPSPKIRERTKLKESNKLIPGVPCSPRIIRNLASKPKLQFNPSVHGPNKKLTEAKGNINSLGSSLSVFRLFKSSSLMVERLSALASGLNSRIRVYFNLFM